MDHQAKALEAFKKLRLNCAQSVLHAFQNEMKIDEQRIAAFKSKGGGRAEGGLCGALHAALELAETQGAKGHIGAKFIERAGSDKCREIKSAGSLSCEACVGLAARLLAESRNPRS